MRVLGILGVVAAAIAAPHVLPDEVLLLGVALVWGIVAVSLVVLTGWAGNISLGQFAIVGAAAVAAGNLVSRWNVDFFVMLVVAAATGALVALLIGVPALRIQGLFLAVTTLAFAVALDSYFLNPVNFDWLIPDDIVRPMLWGRVDLESDVAMYYVCLVALALSVVAAVGIRRSRAGRVLLATRDNDRAAAAMAVPTVGARMAGFLLAGVLAGVAGGLHVLLLHGARTASYPPSASIEVFSMAVIGGLGSLGGALSGVFALRWLEQVVDSAIRLLVTGTGLLVILLVLPGGIGQFAVGARDMVLRRIATRRGILVPSLFADKREEDRPEDETAAIEGALQVDAGAAAREPEPDLELVESRR